ncbi:unnamed protein product [Rotaria socialis]|uniref:AIG1-type G domain-containing protein n=1 Tax=Rotaria socialis TaxID=392032 RepID=A0A818F659_9BILA|nr:unnamed protein product [Rotaria socialis]
MYYRDNGRIMEMIEDFGKSYRSSDVLQWCFHSPFTNHFLLHAIHFRNLEQLKVCRFMFIDTYRFFQQQPKHRLSDQFYRGMKLTTAVLDRFESHVGKLVCTSDFFPCTKSRTNALSLASLPNYRSDLLSVLFKIDCDSTSMYSQVSNKTSSNVILFGVSISFRVINVHRGPMSVIKMKPAVTDGQTIAQEYFKEHHDQSIQAILDEILAVPRVETLPPPPPPPPPPPSLASTSANSIPTSLIRNDDELKAQKYLEQGEIDLALATFRNIQAPVSARILNMIGRLCVEKNRDYEYALECQTRALKILEQKGEDICETLFDLGHIHHLRGQYDLALDYHQRALGIREKIHPDDIAAQSSSLLAIGNAYCARREFDQAIAAIERCLTLQEAQQPVNEVSVGTTLATLGNVYQDSGKHRQALEMCTRALTIFERNLSSDSDVVAELLETMGAIQFDLRLLDNAKQTFERVVDIYTKTLPPGNPARVSAEFELKRKISVGNIILDEKYLKSGKSPIGVTTKCAYGARDFEQKRLFLVDTPEFLDPNIENKAIQHEFADCLSEIFGQTAINHTIIIFTHGDEFEDEEITLDIYLSQLPQTHRLDQLLKRCDQRYLCFNSKVKEQKDETIKQLLRMITDMTSKNSDKVYITDIFAAVAKEIFIEKAKSTFNRLKSDGSYILLPQTNEIVIDGFLRRAVDRQAN